jgi:hypothetical protein
MQSFGARPDCREQREIRLSINENTMTYKELFVSQRAELYVHSRRDIGIQS